MLSRLWADFDWRVLRMGVLTNWDRLVLDRLRCLATALCRILVFAEITVLMAWVAVLRDAGVGARS